MTVKEQQLYYIVAICFARIHNFFRRKPLNPKSILVIKLDEIGDIVNAIHIPGILKKEYPKATITLWVKPFIKPIINGHPTIDFIAISPSELQKKYDIVIDLRGNWDSLKHLLNISHQWLLERGSTRFRNKFNGGQKHEVFTNLDVISPLLKNIPEKPSLLLFPDEQDIRAANDFISNNNIGKYALLHTGARRALRQWNPERFAAIASYLKNNYNFDIVFTGDQNDEARIIEIQQQLNFSSYSTTQVLNLPAFAALCKNASIFIGNESGPMHIASASGCPTIGLFGPGVPTTFYPYGAKSTYIHYVLPCNPCDQIHCVRPDSPCISLISVEDVIQKINLLLGKSNEKDI